MDLSLTFAKYNIHNIVSNTFLASFLLHILAVDIIGDDNQIFSGNTHSLHNLVIGNFVGEIEWNVDKLEEWQEASGTAAEIKMLSWLRRRPVSQWRASSGRDFR